MKQKPRKKSSSAIGATTQTRIDATISASVESSTPSSDGRSSLSVIPSAAAQIAEKTKNPAQATPVQPTVRQSPPRGIRRPNFAAVAGGSSRRAISHATPISARSCT